MGGGRSEGEDLFQDVAVACVKRADDYDWSHPLIDGRVLSIARNLNVRRMRRKRIRQCCHLPADDTMPDSHGSTVDEGIWRHEAAISCRHALERLAPQERAIVWWHVVRAQTFRQIASRLGLREATARCCCHRALKKMRQHPAMLALASVQRVFEPQ